MAVRAETQNRPGIGNPETNRGMMSGGSLSSQEGIFGGRIEIRRGDPRKDAEALAELFAHPAIIGHLAGVAPPMRSEHGDRLRAQNPTLRKIIVATPENLRDYYLTGQDTFFVATHQQRVIGSVTVEGPGLGLYAANIAKLVVHPDYQGQKNGEALLRMAEHYIFSSPNEGGLGCVQARAGVIIDVPGREKPAWLFLKESYKVVGQPEASCASWDSSAKRFRSRDAVWFALRKRRYNEKNRGRDIEQDFPNHSFLSIPRRTS